MPDKEKKVRLNVELPESAHKRMNWLKDKTEATSNAEVVRNAFVYQQNDILIHQSGGKITHTDKNGVSVVVKPTLPTPTDS